MRSDQASVFASQQSRTLLGAPTRVESVGETEVSYGVFLDYVVALGESTFAPSSFHSAKHNSIRFCEEVALFLCGKARVIPDGLAVVPPDGGDGEVSRLLNADRLTDSSAGGISFGCGRRNGSFAAFLPNVAEVTPQRNREPSPDFLELQRQIEALK